MSLSDWASIATIVQGIFVIVSLAIVLYQIREGTRLTRAANTEKLIELTSPFHLQFVQDRETAKLWTQGAKELDKMDQIDRQRYYALLAFWLSLHENIYHQKKQKLLDEDTYISWTCDLKYFIASQNLKLIWHGWSMRDYFEPSFAKYMDRLIDEAK